MGKSSKQKVKLPGWYEDAAKEQIAQAQRVSNMEYMPWMGQVVANTNPQLRGAWNQADAWSQAAGFPGTQGYQYTPPTHAYPMYQQQMDMMQQQYPGMMQQREQMFQPQAPQQMPQNVPSYEELLALFNQLQNNLPGGFGDAGNSVDGISGGDAASVGDSTDAGMGFGGGSDGPY